MDYFVNVNVPALTNLCIHNSTMPGTLYFAWSDGISGPRSYPMLFSGSLPRLRTMKLSGLSFPSFSTDFYSGVVAMNWQHTAYYECPECHTTAALV